MTSTTTKRAALRVRLPLPLLALLAACGGSPAQLAGPPVTLRFAMRGGDDDGKVFRAVARTEEALAAARAQLRLAAADRHLFASGPIAAGTEVNTGWSWHFTDVGLVESAIELCDGGPSMVEANLDYWVGTVQAFCPWGSYVVAEER